MEKEPNFKRGEKGYIQRFVNTFNNEGKVALDDFKTNSGYVISEVNDIKNSLINEINSVKKNIISLENKEDVLQTKLDKIYEFYTSNFEGNDEGIIISEEIDGYVEKFKGYKNEIEGLKNEIDKYKEELFGSEDEEGNKTKGLNHKIDSLKNQLQVTIIDGQDELDDFFEKNGEKRDELFDKIEGLLKGASTVALAKAFKDHKKSFEPSNIAWMISFIASIVSMMLLSVWGFVNANYEFKDMWKYTLGNLPFIGSAIWLAIYSSKQRSQNKRLQQEYAFKEDVAKIYYGLKEEVEELGDSELGKELNKSVLKLVIDVVSLNPSETLYNKSHNDKGPILEALNNATDIIKNIKNPT